jgi:hypothetical protein
LGGVPASPGTCAERISCGMRIQIRHRHKLRKRCTVLECFGPGCTVGLARLVFRVHQRLKDQIFAAKSSNL